MTPTVDQQLFRRTLGQFATGVTVVSFVRDGEVYGMTVNSFSSVSLEPPLVLFCPALTSRFATGASPEELFTISFLAQEQKEICFHFAGLGGLEQEPWEGASPPVLRDCLGWLRCKVRASHTHGDHLVVVGDVLQIGVESSDPPLLFFRGGYPMLFKG